MPSPVRQGNERLGARIELQEIRLYAVTENHTVLGHLGIEDQGGVGSNFTQHQQKIFTNAQSER